MSGTTYPARGRAEYARLGGAASHLAAGDARADRRCRARWASSSRYGTWSQKVFALSLATRYSSSVRHHQATFDQWSYDDVRAHATDILARLRTGSMPCDASWPSEQVDAFSRGVDSGTQA